MFTFVSSGSLRFAGRFAQRAFYSLASPGRAMNAERIPPSSQPCRGRRQNTHKARLVNYSWRDRPHLHPENLHRRRRRRRAFRISQKEKEKKKTMPVIEWSSPRSSVAATRGNFFVVVQRRQPSCDEERFLCCYDFGSLRWLGACLVMVEDLSH